MAVIFLYMVGTFLINIVCLNILISVVTDNYDLVIQRIEAEDAKFKANKLLSIEARHWFFMTKCRRQKPKPMKK